MLEVSDGGPLCRVFVGSVTVIVLELLTSRVTVDRLYPEEAVRVEVSTISVAVIRTVLDGSPTTKVTSMQKARIDGRVSMVDCLFVVEGLVDRQLKVAMNL